MSDVTATILWGANNIFTARSSDGRVLENLRIKGKILGDTDDAYNPLAPGDIVIVGGAEGEAYTIHRRLPRKNAVTRWNRKRRALQTVAANVDRLFVVASARHPRYHPGFVDRVLVMAELENIEAAIIINKSDLSLHDDASRHIETLSRLHYEILRTVAHPEEPRGIETVLRTHRDGTAVFFGESGVGKSSLINLLAPGAALETGEVSFRYDRGRHTTTLARHIGAGNRVYVDTPGVRHFPLDQYVPTEIAAGFREFRPGIEKCRMPSCTHIHEPGCAVREALNRGEISELRYESYCRIVDETRELIP